MSVDGCTMVQLVFASWGVASFEILSWSLRRCAGH